MKKISSLLLVCFSVISLYAQDGFITKIEAAMQTKNSLIKQEVFSVDNINAFRIDAVKITDLEKFNIVSGCRIVQKMQFGKEQKTFTNYIDIDELDGIITALQYMKTILKSNTIPSNYTEIKYNTKAGFQVMLLTILNDFKKLEWNFMVQTDITEEKSLITIPIAELSKLQVAFEQAKSKL